MKKLEVISEKLTQWIGTPASIVVHTFIFVGIFGLRIFGANYDEILLILTTAVSLEAIYLSIFIQMSVNRTTIKISGVEQDINEIQEDVEGISEDVEGISEDIEDISEEVSEYDEDDILVKSVKDIEDRIAKLHKVVNEIKMAKQTEKK